MRHVAILGSAGAGKSRLARELADALELPVVHLDRLYWKPGWVAPTEPEWEAIQRRELGRESWIADGLQENRAGLPDHWLDAADTIVFIDASPLLCVWRVIRRRLSSEAGPEMPADCKPAPFYRAFPKFLRLLLIYRRFVRADVLAELARREHRQKVAVLRGGDDMGTFLESATAHRAAVGESLMK